MQQRVQVLPPDDAVQLVARGAELPDVPGGQAVGDRGVLGVDVPLVGALVRNADVGEAARGGIHRGDGAGGCGDIKPERKAVNYGGYCADSLF